MKAILASILLISQLASANACYEVYESAASASRMQLFRNRLDTAIENITESCMAGASACSTHLTSSTKKAANIVGFAAAVNARTLNKLITSPISTMRFSIEQDKVREMIIEPLAEAINKGKDAEANLLRIENNLITPQTLVKPSLKERFTFGLLKNKKTDEQILKELEEQIVDSEIELWAHSEYSAGLLAVVGIPKLVASLASGLAVIQGGSNVAFDVAKKIVMTRLAKSFDANKDLAMMDRLKTSITDAFNFQDKTDVMEARDLIYSQFGFDKLLQSINRDVAAEAQTVPEKK